VARGLSTRRQNKEDRITNNKGEGRVVEPAQTAQIEKIVFTTDRTSFHR
jgi:hypothetical protein